jgi:hypothetical protein
VAYCVVKGILSQRRLPPFATPPFHPRLSAAGQNRASDFRFVFSLTTCNNRSKPYQICFMNVFLQQMK